MTTSAIGRLSNAKMLEAAQVLTVFQPHMSPDKSEKKELLHQSFRLYLGAQTHDQPKCFQNNHKKQENKLPKCPLILSNMNKCVFVFNNTFRT